MQNAIDDREEIEEPPFGQRRRDRPAAFSGTKSFSVDVRMRGFITRHGRIRFERDDRVGRIACEPLGIQADTE